MTLDYFISVFFVAIFFALLPALIIKGLFKIIKTLKK